jgi:hypothetical protein
MKQRPPSKKGQFIKQVVVGFGFLSGLWIHIGFDPGTFVYDFLSKLLIHAKPEYTQSITILFFALPIILTCISVLGVYRRAGYFGLFAVGMAFLAGLWLNILSIPLLLGAVVIGFVAARR